MNYQDVTIETFGLKKTKEKKKEIVDGKEVEKSYKKWTFKVRMSSPEGSIPIDDAVDVSFDYSSISKKIAKIKNRRLKDQDLINFGLELGDYLIPNHAGESSLRSLFEKSFRVVSNQGDGIRLRLKLDSELAKLPWEVIYLPPPGGIGSMDGFLALSKDFSIVRHEVFDRFIPDPTAAGKIKMVASFASPEGTAELDLKQEQKNLTDAISETQDLEVDMLADSAFKELSEKLILEDDVGVFHFAGHGEIREEMGEVPGETLVKELLGFKDAWIEAKELAEVLRNAKVRLVFLGACNSGLRSGKNPWSGISSMLVKTGIPVVIANQFKILDKTAIAFSKLFYKALVGGMSIEEAVSAGRRAAYHADTAGRDWGIQVMYLRSAHSQILFGGTADKAQKEEYRKEVTETIIQNITNINSGGGAVFKEAVHIAGNFVGGNQSSTTVNFEGGNSGNLVFGSGNSRETSNEPVAQPKQENEDINDVMAVLRVDVMGKVSANHKQATRERLSQLEDELQKGTQADDSEIATMIKDLSEWVPEGNEAIKTAFADPALKSFAEGAVTIFMLEQL